MRVYIAVGLLDTIFSRWEDNIAKTEVNKAPEFRRKYDLWVQPVELLFTMNEPQIKEVYNSLSKNQQGAADKPSNQDVVALSDLQWFFTKVLGYKFSAQEMQQCYVESKMTIVNEQEKDALAKYRKLVYVEFLEFIARFSMRIFEQSEMAELQLNEKIEYVLDAMFDPYGLKREKQVTTIEEFSASDDDY